MKKSKFSSYKVGDRVICCNGYKPARTGTIKALVVGGFIEVIYDDGSNGGHWTVEKFVRPRPWTKLERALK